MDEQKPARKPARGGSRPIARELALRAVYEWLVSHNDLAALLTHMEDCEECGPLWNEANMGFFRELLDGVLAHAVALDAALAPHLDRTVAELSPVEHAVLLIGAYELTHTLNVPYKVAINEAVNLTKSYGGTDGHKFVNGVLDKLARVTRAVELAAAGRSQVVRGAAPEGDLAPSGGGSGLTSRG